jgi:putative transposase
VSHAGAYIITASTLNKERLFVTHEKLDLLETTLLETAYELGWEIQAWAVFPNHYHFVGLSPEGGLDRKKLLGKIHGKTAIALNKLDQRPGREVWFRCWDTRITYEASHMARLAYVHSNPVKHGLVSEARHYKWCSALWLEQTAPRSFYETLMSFKTDQVRVVDDF